MSDAATIKRLTLELKQAKQKHEEALDFCERYMKHLHKAIQRADTLAASLKDIAEHDCEYGDNCPSNAGTRHGTCIPCQARKGLQAAEPNPLICPDCGFPRRSATCRKGCP